jgi:DNA-binding response OmpR family regulator
MLFHILLHMLYTILITNNCYLVETEEVMEIDNNKLSYKNLSIDIKAHKVLVNDKSIHFARIDYEILLFLMQNK